MSVNTVVPSSAASVPLLTRMYFVVLKIVLRVLLALRYRVRVEGLDSLRTSPDDRRPILFLPSHSALVDPLIMYSLLADFRPRALADARQVDRPLIRSLIRPLRPLVLPDMQKDGRDAAQAVREVLDSAAAALAQGDNCLLYPTGRLTRDGLDRVGSNSGAFSLYSRVPTCRVVLVRIRGLWGSSFSYAPCNERGGKAPDFFRALLKGFGRLCANGILFMPRRPVRVLLQEATALPPVAAGVMPFNQALEAFYQAEAQPLMPMSVYFWRGLTARDRALAAQEPVPVAGDAVGTVHGAAGDVQAEGSIDPALREAVFAILRVESGMTDFGLNSMLAGDLGIDSLSLVNVALQLEERFGHPIPNLEALHTVEDCLRAATGQLEGATVPEAPEEWLALGRAGTDRADNPPNPVVLPSGKTIPQVFFQQVHDLPQRLQLGDASGTLSRKTVALRALALAAALRADFGNEDRLGIMLPASSAATVVWLAVLLAGKTPVMFNWTTGETNFRHCLDISGVQHVLTARKLMQRLEQQGFSPAVLTGGDAQAAQQGSHTGGAWVYLEDMAAQLPLRHKLRATVQTGLVLLGLGRLVLPSSPPLLRTQGQGAGDSIAAILFTSGSESRPKAVPLSHSNILANCRDVAEVLGLHSADSMLGMLPPFHSLGLTGNIVVPLAFGMPVVYHPNPTEATQLNAICRTWRPSMTVSPPTFLEGMLHKAKAGDLTSLRLAFVGAEKCPLSLYQAFSAQTDGGILCEGYGVTECAPGVCVNPPSAPSPGTIGLALPSVSLAVVVEAADAPLRRAPRRAAPDEQGMLLIAGPNVFAGYLAPRGNAEGTPPDDPFVFFEGQRWYRSGDLVSADAHGHLTFRGRLKRFVKIGGEMLSLPQMEELLLTAFEARREGREGPLLALESCDMDEKPVITLFTTLPLSKDEANAALRAGGLSGLHAVHAVREVETIPVLGTGKTDYQSLKLLLKQ